VGVGTEDLVMFVNFAAEDRQLLWLPLHQECFRKVPAKLLPRLSPPR